MTWTYTNDPSTSLRDRVRFLIQDTDTTDQLVSDEEIAWMLTDKGNAQMAAAAIALSLAAKFARRADTTVGEVSESWGAVAEHYMALANELKAAAAARCLPSIGGRSETEKANLDSDRNAVQPFFRKGQYDTVGDAQPDKRTDPALGDE